MYIQIIFRAKKAGLAHTGKREDYICSCQLAYCHQGAQKAFLVNKDILCKKVP